MCVSQGNARRGEAGDWPRQLSGMHHGWWMVDGGESGVLEGGPSIDFSAGEGRMGRFRSRSDPCGLVAGHCSIALLVSDVATTTGLLPLMEGGRRRRNNLECKKKRRKRHEFHRQMAGGRPVRNSGSPHLPAAITLILPMAQTVCGREGQVQLRWMGSCVVPFCSGLFCPFVRTFAWPLSLSKCHSLSNLPFSAWVCTTKDDRPVDTPRRHIAHPP